MPRSKDPSKYPKRFFDVIERLRDRDDPLEIFFPTTGKCHSFRLDFATFASGVAINDNMMEFLECRSFITAIEMKVRDDPPRVVLSKKDFGEMSNFIEASLEADRKKHEDEQKS